MMGMKKQHMELLMNGKKISDGALALCILLDQMPRNMFRGMPKAFETDKKALVVAKFALSKGLDQVLSVQKRRFLYLPFEHSENINDQRRCVELFEKMKDDDPLGYDYALRHLKVIEEFGRFPHRNAILARDNTPEEEAYLAKSSEGLLICLSGFKLGSLILLPTLVLLNIIAGVCLLLWGVKLLRLGVTYGFGAELRRILAASTSNRFKSFFSGMGITALLQSSTATIIIVSGFAAQGMVKSSAGLGMVLGADVGTTLVAQFFSLNLKFLIPVIMILGYIFFSLKGVGKFKNIGRVLVGAALMLFALGWIRDVTEPVERIRAFTRDFRGIGSRSIFYRFNCGCAHMVDAFVSCYRFACYVVRCNGGITACCSTLYGFRREFGRHNSLRYWRP